MPSTYPELKNRTALVTGATAGIGKAVALILAQDGVHVAVVGRDRVRGEAVADQCSSLGTRSFFAPADLAVPKQTDEMFQEVLARMDKVEILINCAGGFSHLAHLWEYSVADWDEAINSNLRSTFLCCRLALPGMVERRWGRIVNVSSAVARTVPYLTSALYSAAKAGVLGMTRHLAAEVAAYGITVNAICPGLTRSERVIRMLSPERIAERLKSVPLGRMSEPEEQAWTVVFLCSDRADYITGTTIDVAGGMVLV